ncbi:hypothetical protein CXB51_009241 [Gossypium anomalum]|uniref:SWIM-type domain-containing protein n=1 Tax=Gossypium anomalum TaxID=47600 RepID=A0A8J6D5A6_9ROSI|nr:hypothetical protein CXB51_009241 [Gossypium anomalum]
MNITLACMLVASLSVAYFLGNIVQTSRPYHKVQIIYFYVPNSMNLEDEFRDINFIVMLNYWYKYFEINLCVDHEIDNPNILKDEPLLLTGGLYKNSLMEKLKDFKEKYVMIGQDINGNLEGIESEPEIEVIGDAVVQKEHEEDTTKVDCDEIEYYDSDDHEGCFFKRRHCHPKIFKGSRKELKIVTNGSKHIRVKCVASTKCLSRIFTIYSRSISNYKGPSKNELKEIQRRVASELHTSKKKVSEILAGNCNDEFELLWDCANELRAKNPSSTIKMVVKRVTPDSSLHFKRFYIYFDALKRGWKEGCRLILVAVGRDVNNQMYPIVWAIIKNYGLSVKRKFDQNKKDGVQWQIVWNDDNGCEVKRGRKQYIINLQERICSCRSWQLTSLPCTHACSAYETWVVSQMIIWINITKKKCT